MNSGPGEPGKHNAKSLGGNSTMSTERSIAPVRIDQSTGLAQIGMTRHEMMGIRYEGGEGGAAPAPAAPAATVEATAPASPATLAAAVGQAHAAQAPQAPATPPAVAPAPDAAQVAADAAQEPVNGVKFADLDPATQAYVRSLRGEAQTHRETAERLQSEQTARETEIRKALGLEPKDGDAPDPAAQAAQLTSTLADTQRENAVLRIAPGLGANADILLDSKAFATEIAGVNPSDSAALTAAITKFVENHATARIVTAAGSSGTAGAGTGGTQMPAEPSTLLDAVSASIAASRGKV